MNSTLFFVETALLTHGLVSVSDESLLKGWRIGEPCLAWVESGALRIGTMEEYLPFRRKAGKALRISSDKLDRAYAEGWDGALTASGTMEAARRAGIGVAVTCGMGGIGEIAAEELCPDLPAVRDLPVVLIGAAPKDVVDISATIGWLLREGAAVYGRYEAFVSGYLAVGKKVALSGVYAGQKLTPPALLLNPIPEGNRPAGPHEVELAMAAGRAAEALGEPYHPAANRKFDELSGGLTSRLQYLQLVENALWARELTCRRT